MAKARDSWRMNDEQAPLCHHLVLTLAAVKWWLLLGLLQHKGSPSCECRIIVTGCREVAFKGKTMSRPFSW